jgi:hypothetical protein
MLALLLVTMGWTDVAHAANQCVNPGGTGGCFASVREAIEAADVGDQVTIEAGTYIESFTLDKAVSLVGEGSDVTILQAMPDDRVMTATGSMIDSSVVISGVTFTGGDVVSATLNVGGGVFLTDTASPLFHGVVITANRALQGGGLFAAPGSVVQFTDVSVISNTAGFIGGGVVAGSLGLGLGSNVHDVIITNSLFERNVGGQAGGLLGGGVVSLTDTDFINNFGIGGGGGVGITTTITGGSFVGNNGGFAGGGWFNLGPLSMDGTTFSGNAAQLGGGLATISETLVSNAQFHGNVAQDAGGGLLSFGNIVLNNVTMISNTARVLGGGAAAGFTGSSDVELSQLTVTNSRFERNSVTTGGGFGGGGGVFVAGEGIISATEFVSNTSQGLGGAGFAVTTTLESSWLEGNSSNVYAGGWMSLGPTVVSDTAVVRNSAVAAGGILVAGEATFIENQFVGNRATMGNGGGLFALGTAPLFVAQNEFYDNRARNVGGAVYYGTVISESSALAAGEALALLALPYGSERWASPEAVEGGAGSTIVNSVFGDNQSVQEGAAIYLGAEQTVALLHNTIAAQNLAPTLEAVTVVSGTATVMNTIIANHGVGIRESGGTVMEDYNLFFGNTDNLLGTIASGGNSFEGDPMFVSPAANDYHITAGSAAIDAGTDVGVDVDFDEEPRPQGEGFDIGADELAQEPTAITQTSLLVGESASPWMGLVVAMAGVLLLGARMWSIHARRS